MRRLSVSLILVLALPLVSYSQVQTQICQGRICVTLPPDPLLTPPVPPTTAAAPSPAPLPVSALAPISPTRPAASSGSHAPVVLGVAISAGVTLVLVKLFKKHKGSK